MKGIVEEIKASIKEDADSALRIKVMSFVKGKLKRVEAIEANIKNLEDEKAKIQESLDKIEEGDYTEVTSDNGITLNWSMVPAKPFNSSLDGSWNFNELEISEDEHGKCVKMNGKVVSR